MSPLLRLGALPAANGSHISSRWCSLADMIRRGPGGVSAPATLKLPRSLYADRFVLYSNRTAVTMSLSTGIVTGWSMVHLTVDLFECLSTALGFPGNSIPTPKSFNNGRDVQYTRGTTTIRVIQDQLHKAVQAVVSPSTMTLTVGGKVDGALHRAAGPALLAEAQTIRKTHGNCPPGNAVIALAGDQIPADYVIHAVGPMWAGGGANEDDTLYTTYWNALWLAFQNDVKSVALPSLSTDVYGFPLEQAAMVATQAVVKFIDKHPDAFSVIWHVVGIKVQAARTALGIQLPRQPVESPEEATDGE